PPRPAKPPSAPLAYDHGGPAAEQTPPRDRSRRPPTGMEGEARQGPSRCPAGATGCTTAEPGKGTSGTVLRMMQETQAPWPARDGTRITGVRAIVTAPEGLPVIAVRVDTSEPGLYGLGCATFTQRFHAVAAAVDKHIGPMVVGR